MKMHNSDPIHLVNDAEPCSECKTGCNYCNNQGYFDPGWYFWDETWTQRYGPFPNEKVARHMLAEYAKTI
jgi:hypothetical protein